MSENRVSVAERQRPRVDQYRRTGQHPRTGQRRLVALPQPVGTRPSVTRTQPGVLMLLAVATAIGGTGLAAGGTSGALLGAELGGTSAAAGLPLGLLVVGSAIGALLISWEAGRGRRGRGLMLGYAIGAAGAVVVIVSTVLRDLPLLLAGSTALGTANSSIFLTRYAAVAASTPASRGRALGMVFSATAIGAVFSPMLLGPSGALAEAVGLPALAGMYLVSVVTFGAAGLMFAAAANPRVPWFSQAAGVLRHDRPRRGRTTEGDRSAALRRLVDAVTGVRARLALVALVTTNFVMAGIMAVAPVDLTAGGHTLSSVGAIIALHVAGMFAVSPLSGHLADRFGPATVVAAGAALLLVASVAGLFVHDTLSMTGHLIVLGVGWNLGIVGGSALLTDAVPDSLRPHVEGVGEVLMGLAAAVAAPVAAVVAVLGGYSALALVSGGVAVGVLVFMHMSSLRRVA